MHQQMRWKPFCVLHVAHFFAERRFIVDEFTAHKVPARLYQILWNVTQKEEQVIVGKKCLFLLCRKVKSGWLRFSLRITENALRDLSAYFLRFSGLHYKWRLFISVLKMYANQAVAQTSPRRRVLLIQKAPFITNRANCELQLLRLIQQVWQPNPKAST